MTVTDDDDPTTARRRFPWIGVELSAGGGLGLWVGSLAVGWFALPPGTVMWILGAAGICATFGVFFRTGSMPLTMLTLAWTVLTLAWFIYALSRSPWDSHALTLLICAVLFLAFLGTETWARWDKAMDRYAAGELARMDLLERRRYEKIFALLGQPVTVTAVDEDRSGTLVRIQPPSDGKITLTSLDSIARNVEVALKARPGSIRFEHGAHAGEITMRRSEKDILVQPVHMPADYGPLTVNRPVRIATLEDGRPYETLFREVATLAVGERGSGKSNLANVIIAQLVRCIDVIVLVIDLKQGRMARPWVAPWVNNPAVIGRPSVDWVATTREEAHIMLSALVRGIEARAGSGYGGEKLTPDREHPAVLLVTDEIKVMFDYRRGPKIPMDPDAPAVITNSELAMLGTDVTERGRSEAIDPILFALRGVSDSTGGTDIKAQCHKRIGLRCASEAEARYVLEDDARVQRILAGMKHAGSAVIQDERTGPHVLKIDRVEYEQIAEIAAATWALRPEPEPLLADAWGSAWADRWSDERAGAFKRALMATPSAGGVALTVASDHVRLTDDQAFKDLVSSGALGADPEAGLDERHRFMRQLIFDAKGSVSPKWLLRLLGEAHRQGRLDRDAPARAVLHRWLKADVADGIIVKDSFGAYAKPRPGQSRAA